MDYVRTVVSPNQHKVEGKVKDLLGCCLQVQGEMINHFYISRINDRLQGQGKEYISGFLAGMDLDVKRTQAINVMFAEVTMAYFLLFAPDY